MREQEMRECVGHFLKARMRAMLLPATLGLGLAVSGCDKQALESTDDSGIGGQVEAGVTHPDTMVIPPVATKYIAQLPDASIAPAYMAQNPDVRVNDALSPDASIAPEYMAKNPDVRANDALSPDAAVMVRYMAPQPIPGGPVLLYMAQYPGT